MGRGLLGLGRPAGPLPVLRLRSAGRRFISLVHWPQLRRGVQRRSAVLIPRAQDPQGRQPVSYNFLYWFKAARSAPRARLGPRPGLRSCLRPAPARPAPVPRASAISHLMPEKGHVVAGAVGSTALRSHFGASLEDHGPNVVLYRAGPQTARRAGSLRGHDHSRQSSATPKPFRRRSHPLDPIHSRLTHATRILAQNLN
jgi:hypothetical protein